MQIAEPVLDVQPRAIAGWSLERPVIGNGHAARARPGRLVRGQRRWDEGGLSAVLAVQCLESLGLAFPSFACDALGGQRTERLDQMLRWIGEDSVELLGAVGALLLARVVASGGTG